MSTPGRTRLRSTQPARPFPCFQRELSTDLTSLDDHEDRAAVAIEMVISDAGEMHSSDTYRALVRNHAKLGLQQRGAWLEGKGPMPDAKKFLPKSLFS